MEKYRQLFEQFALAPMEGFLKILFKGVSAEVRKQLVLEECVDYYKSMEG